MCNWFPHLQTAENSLITCKVESTCEAAQIVRPCFRHQQKFCSEGHHMLDLSPNLPKLQVWNVLTNNTACSLLIPVTNICCSVTATNRILQERHPMQDDDVLCLVTLTCMFVRRMCFWALLTASLLQEEGSTLHHKETLAQAANKREKSYSGWSRRCISDTILLRNSSVSSANKINLTLRHKVENRLNRRKQFGDDYKSLMSSSGELTPQLRREAKLPRYRNRSHRADARIQVVSWNVFYLRLICCVGSTQIWLVRSLLSCKNAPKTNVADQTALGEALTLKSSIKYICKSPDMIRLGFKTVNR